MFVFQVSTARVETQPKKNAIGVDTLSLGFGDFFGEKNACCKGWKLEVGEVYLSHQIRIHGTTVYVPIYMNG